MEKSEFLYPKYPYRGQVKPENLVFNANLQEFSVRVNYITGLATNGKLTSYEAYRQVKTLWKHLKHSKQQLSITQSDSDNFD